MEKSSNLSKIEEVSEEKIEELVQIITRQTDYTYTEANEKLEEFNYDHVKVIKNYLGIVDKKEPPIKSVNQEIYRQLRSKLNVPIDYSKLQKDIDENNSKM